MKLVYFDDFKLGVLKDDTVVDVSAAVEDIPHTGPGDLMNGLIEHWEQLQASTRGGGGTRRRGAGVGRAHPSAGAGSAHDRLHGGQLHGRRHAQRAGAGQRLPQIAERHHRTWRHHGAAGCAGHWPSKARPRSRSSSARSAANVSEAEAMDYVFGYMNFIDGSARGLPPPGKRIFPDEEPRHIRADRSLSCHRR